VVKKIKGKVHYFGRGLILTGHWPGISKPLQTSRPGDREVRSAGEADDSGIGQRFLTFKQHKVDTGGTTSVPSTSTRRRAPA